VTPPFRIVGLDLSLTSTGLAIIDDTTIGTATGRITPKGMNGHARMKYILASVAALTARTGVVVIEGPSFGSANGQKGHHERGGLWWLITYALWLENQPVAIVPPSVLKKYLTGKGNASKDAVLAAAIRRYPAVDFDGNDEADALGLAAMAADWYGHPLAPVPAAQRAALTAVTWPILASPPVPTGVTS
jgi:crossover junction endodeoxyribonuclease RuvC